MALKPKKLSILLLVFGTCFHTTLLAKSINFSQAWQLLQEKNNSIAAQRANVQHHQQLEQAEDSLNYPKVTIGANYTRLDDDVTLSGEQIYNSLSASGKSTFASVAGSLGLSLGDITSTITDKDLFTSSIRAVWPIYTGGRIGAAQSYSQGKTAEAVAQLKMETKARYEDLSKYYFSAVLANQVLETRLSVEKGLTQHRDFAIKLEKQGQIAHVERLQAEASLTKAIVDRKKSQRDLDISLSALTEILNQQQAVTPQSPLFINQSLPEIELFTNRTLETYPGLDLLSAKEKQANSAIVAEKGKYHPEVFLYGDYSLYEDDTLASELAPDWFVGVGVSVPLIDNSGRSEKVQAAQSTILQVRHLRYQAKQDLTLLVEKTYSQATQAIEEVNGLEISLSLAKENLRLRKKSFNQGLATSLDVIDAELYLASITTQQQVAKFNYILALNKLLLLSDQIDTFSQYEQNAINLTGANNETS